MKNPGKNILPAIACVALLLLASCSGDPVKEKPRVFEGYGLWMDTVLKSTDKIVRGLEPGMTAEEIKKVEAVPPAEEDSASLYYEISVDSVTDVLCTYTLDNNRLDEMEMLIRCRNHDAGAAMFNDLKKYFDSRFSAPVSEKGIFVYSAKSSAGDPLRISLEDRSGVDDALISVLVYREK